MDRTRIDEGVRRMRFESLLDRQEGSEITQGEAAELLGVQERYTAGGVQIVEPPTVPSMAPCSEPSRPSPGGRAKCAALTAPAREAFGAARVGTKKRASSRTKKLHQDKACTARLQTTTDRGAPPACPPIIRARKSGQITSYENRTS